MWNRNPNPEGNQVINSRLSLVERGLAQVRIARDNRGPLQCQQTFQDAGRPDNNEESTLRKLTDWSCGPGTSSS